MAPVHQKAGDVVIFTEALTHGTLPLDCDRTNAAQFCSSIHRVTLHGDRADTTMELRNLMSEEDQKLMLEPPYVANRKPVV